MHGRPISGALGDVPASSNTLGAACACAEAPGWGARPALPSKSFKTGSVQVETPWPPQIAGPSGACFPALKSTGSSAGLCPTWRSGNGPSLSFARSLLETPAPAPAPAAVGRVLSTYLRVWAIGHPIKISSRQTPDIWSTWPRLRPTLLSLHVSGHWQSKTSATWLRLALTEAQHHHILGDFFLIIASTLFLPTLGSESARLSDGVLGDL